MENSVPMETLDSMLDEPSSGSMATTYFPCFEISLSRMMISSFSSEPIKLPAGETAFEILATDAEHIQAKMAFVARYSPTVVPASQTTSRPIGKSLTKAEILGLLEGGVPSKRVTVIVGERGISFAPTDDDIKQIRAAGGDDNLVTAVTKAKRQ